MRLGKALARCFRREGGASETALRDKYCMVGVPNTLRISCRVSGLKGLFPESLRCVRGSGIFWLAVLTQPINPGMSCPGKSKTYNFSRFWNGLIVLMYFGGGRRLSLYVSEMRDMVRMFGMFGTSHQMSMSDTPTKKFVTVDDEASGLGSAVL